MNLTDIKTKFNATDKIDKVRRRTRKNDLYADYFEDFFKQSGEDPLYSSFPNVAANMRACCQWWTVDHYRFIGVKELVKTNLCKNKFCDNCQNALSVKRFNKFKPVLSFLSKDFDVFHAVFTVPNVFGEELKNAVDKLFANFRHIYRYLIGDAKIKGLDFSKYGFRGAIRALEVTKNKERGDFHPHLHCIFVFKKDSSIMKGKRIVNQYSFNNQDYKTHKKDAVRMFTPFEILMQKIWFLRINKMRVNLDALEELDVGYSVIFEKATDNRFKEVFKYAIKGCVDSESGVATYYDFLALYFALHKRHIVQGYGILNHFTFDETLLEEDNDKEEYLELLRALSRLSVPESIDRIYEDLRTISENVKNKDITYIARKKVLELGESDDE